MNRNGVPVPSKPWCYNSTTGHTRRWAALPDDWPVYLTRCLFVTAMSSASDYLARHRSLVFATDRSANVSNTRRLRLSVNEGGRDSLSVRRRRAGWRTGQHAQWWEKSQFSIISYEIDSILINQIESKSNRISIYRTITMDTGQCRSFVRRVFLKSVNSVVFNNP